MRMKGPDFLLIREIGAGLWNEMHHILAQLLAAEILNRVPVIYWGKGSLYAANDGSNAFEQFFMPVSDFSIQDLAKQEYSFFPDDGTAIIFSCPTGTMEKRRLRIWP